MTDIEKPKIEIAEISEDGRYGRFVCEPLEPGYGTTFGNSLRRKWSRFFSSTEAETARRCPRNGISFQVCNCYDSIIERSLNVYITFKYALLFLSLFSCSHQFPPP
mgnify:CR=1 FL=1